MRKVFSYISVCFILLFSSAFVGFNIVHANNQASNRPQQEIQEPDSTKQETRFQPLEKTNNPFLDPGQTNAIQLKQTESLTYTSKYNPKTGLVYFYRKIGNIDVLLPYTMTLEEYMDDDIRNSMMAYWEERSRTNDNDGRFDLFNPNINLGIDGLDNLFGGNLINIKPQGRAELRIGINTTEIDNPTLQENLRKTTTFDFEEKIQMNIQGNIGDKVKLGINYNTEATFDFENEVKLEYEGKEDDIIQSIEAGNVSLSLPGTLITGSQSLFGVKTDMQFGKLSVSTVLSQQRGETSVLDIQGGAQKQEFELPINEYDKNRHFFLSNFFRDQYNEAQKNYPIQSKITVKKIEVWITNRASNFDDARNILGFMDLGETGSNMYNTDAWDPAPYKNPDNESNNLYNQLNNRYSAIRDINAVSKTFSGTSIVSGIDYEKIENARLLSPSEYTLNSRLGFISLNSSLNADEVLAVAFEYDYAGETFTVGEFTNSLSEAGSTLFLKLIKSTNLTPEVKPTWDLMMKNIYAIRAYQVNRDDFEFDIAYVDDSTGAYINYLPEDYLFPEDSIPLLLRLLDLDKLNEVYDPIPDGTFDYIENQTIYPQNGRIIFPMLEPFGTHIKELIENRPNLTDTQKQQLIDKYVYQSLYTTTQTLATQEAEKNKFWLRGSYKSSTSSEISLNAQNIPQGSVIVTAGGIKLTENVDYTVDYSFGTVKIINQGLLSSGSPIQVSLESQSLFNLQTKTLIGTHLNYQFNENFNIGGTVEYLREQPLTQKVNIGDEPIANTIYGFNTSYFTESQWLTNTLDKLPLLQLKDPSSVEFEGEFAQLLPGHPNVIEDEGQAYIDDFEGTETSIDMRNWTAWSLASTPKGQPDMFPNADNINDLSYGYDRAKLAWYTIDPLFSRKNQYTPNHIFSDLDEKSNHYVRQIFQDEIFPNRETAYGEPTYLSVLNLAYYPKERGPYNYQTDGYDTNGQLINTDNNWGGIQRRVETNDFETANIEFIEFWVMDPFIYNENLDGDLFINLGNISEDVLNDSRKYFEQGMPGPDEPFEVDSTAWGYVPTKQSLVNAFSNEPNVRIRQDIGLDGLTNEQERSFHKAFMDQIEFLRNNGGLSEEAYQKIYDDPSADNYHYYRGSDFDQNKVGILDRYKNFNGPEGNSVPSEFSPEAYSTAALSQPDQEDINKDNTLSETESYFQYHVALNADNMQVGENYITDLRTKVITLPNDKVDTVKWYQFRIPVATPDATVGNISDFRSIRFMRMFLRGFNDTTVLRFATLDLVRSEWRKYTNELAEKNEVIATNQNTRFETGSVNIEENADKTPIGYVLPPGIDRIIDPANPQLRQLNEQSIILKVTNLPKNERKAIFKTMNIDMRQYGRIKMEVHAEELIGEEGSIGDNNVMAFIRMGSDSKDNYYEYEIPLKMSPHGTIIAEEVWPESNRFDFDLQELQTTKLERNRSNSPTNDVFRRQVGNNLIKIKGNPNLGNIRTIMLGVRSTVGNKDVSFETWFNELRLSNFNEKGGWAANARMNVKLSDFGNVSFAGSTSSAGFGSIDQSVTERSQEDFYQYDFATNLELGKLLGAESRMSIPFYYSQSKEVTTPEYYPLDPDIPIDVALDNAQSDAERDSIKNLSQDVVDRKSINFTNVKLKPKNNEKPKIYDVSNLSATYAYNETKAHDPNTEKSIDKDFKAVLAYNFNNRPKVYEPFKNSKLLKGKAFKLIKDFNFSLMPTQLSYKTEMLRNYRETHLRNLNNPSYKIPVTVRKDFNWNRYFDIRYNLTKSLKFDFSSATNARIDEPEGLVNKEDMDQYDLWKDSVLTNIFNGGRVTNYQHNFNINYNLPINKLPLLNWTNSTVRYTGMYNWVAAPQSTDETLDWGNTIRNSNNVQGSFQMNLNTLYNQSKYLKGLSRKYGNQRSENKNTKRTVRYNDEGITLVKGQSYIINHKLKTDDVRVRMFDQNGRTARGKTVPINDSKIEFIPEADYEDARVMVTGTVEDKTTIIGTIVDYTAMVATGVKNISLNYNETNGTILPGYLPSSRFMGTSTYNGFSAPGYGFVLGMQDRNFAKKAADNGWITADEINQPYIMTHQEDFTVKATIQPINGLRIDLNANRRYSNNMDEYYFMEGDKFSSSNTRENDNFSMTFNIINTAFNKVSKKGTFESSAYNKFLSNRQDILDRLIGKREGNPDNKTDEYSLKPNKYGYNEYSQDVLIPAFLSAYSGTDPDNIFLDLFPSILKMHPNWRVTYNGLSKIKPLKKYIRSFDISHGYRSTYNIGSYATNIDYNDNESGISWIRDVQQNLYLSEYQVNSVTLDETFSPLIGFNITWQNSLTTRFEIKNKRTLNLSLTSNQLIENHNDEFVIGLGYRFDKMDMILGSGRGAKKMSSDLNLRFDISVRDNISLIRKIEDGVNQLTSGAKITTIKFTADYVLSDRFNMQVFYDRGVNKPYISLSYPTTTSNFGVSFSFSLTQ